MGKSFIIATGNILELVLKNPLMGGRVKKMKKNSVNVASYNVSQIHLFRIFTNVLSNYKAIFAPLFDQPTESSLHKKWNFPLRISSVNTTPNPQFPADLVTFTEEVLDGKLHFLN